MRIKIDTTVEVWQVRSVDGGLFASLDTEPGLLRLVASAIGGRVLAVLAWDCGDFTVSADTVVLAESTARLEEFLSKKGHGGAHWTVLWRSDKPIVASVKYSFNKSISGACG